MSLTWLGKLITKNKFNNVLNLKRIDLSLLKSHNSILFPPQWKKKLKIYFALNAILKKLIEHMNSG